MLACTDEKYLQAIHINAMSFNSKNKSLKKQQIANAILYGYVTHFDSTCERYVAIWIIIMHFLCASAYYKILCRKKLFHPTWFSFNLPCIFIYMYLCFICIFEKPFAILYLKVSYLSNNKHFFTFSIAKTLYFVQIFEHAIRRQIYTQFPAIEVLHLCTYLSTLAYIIRVIDTIF